MFLRIAYQYQRIKILELLLSCLEASIGINPSIREYQLALSQLNLASLIQNSESLVTKAVASLEKEENNDAFKSLKDRLSPNQELQESFCYEPFKETKVVRKMPIEKLMDQLKSHDVHVTMINKPCELSCCNVDVSFVQYSFDSLVQSCICLSRPWTSEFEGKLSLLETQEVSNVLLWTRRAFQDNDDSTLEKLAQYLDFEIDDFEAIVRGKTETSISTINCMTIEFFPRNTSELNEEETLFIAEEAYLRTRDLIDAKCFYFLCQNSKTKSFSSTLKDMLSTCNNYWLHQLSTGNFL